MACGSSSDAKYSRRGDEHVVVCSVIGDPQCGKTSLIDRFKQDNFDYLTRLGVDFWTKPLPFVVGNDLIHIKIKEIEGKQFCTLTSGYSMPRKAVRVEPAVFFG